MLKIKNLLLVSLVFVVPAVFALSCYDSELKKPIKNKPYKRIIKELKSTIEAQYFPFKFNHLFKQYALVKSVEDMEILKKNLIINEPMLKNDTQKSMKEFQEFEKTKNDFLAYLDRRFSKNFFEENNFVFYQTSYPEVDNSGLFLDSIGYDKYKRLYLNFIYKAKIVGDLDKNQVPSGLIVNSRIYIAIVPKVYNLSVEINDIDTLSKFQDYRKNTDIREYKKDPHQDFDWKKWKSQHNNSEWLSKTETLKRQGILITDYDLRLEKQIEDGTWTTAKDIVSINSNVELIHHTSSNDANYRIKIIKNNDAVFENSVWDTVAVTYVKN